MKFILDVISVLFVVAFLAFLCAFPINCILVLLLPVFGVIINTVVLFRVLYLTSLIFIGVCVLCMAIGARL